MASVIHKTTLEFRASANEPDFPEPTWKWSPDMSQVAGVPFKYWKWDISNDRPIEMSAGEKTAVDDALAAAAAATLETAQTNSQPGLQKGDMAAVNAAGKIKRLPAGPDGEIIGYDSTLPLGVGSFRRLKPVVKPGNTSRTGTTTLAADPELTFPVEADKAYIFRFGIFFDTTANADFKFGVSGPASPVEVRIERHAIAPGATAFSAVGVQTAFNGAGTAVVGTGTTGGYVEINGKFLNGPNAGNVALIWAQNTSDGGNTLVKGGSVLEWVKTN